MTDVEKVRAIVKAAYDSKAPIQDTAFRLGVNPSTAYRWSRGQGPTSNRAAAALASWRERQPAKRR